MADRGHELTEKMLADLEKRLHDEYTQAARELQKTLDDYMKRYRTKDKIWQKWVADGTKTQKEYDEWRIGQLAMGDRWEKMKNQIITDQMHTNEIARQIIQKQMPSVFSLNANYATYQVEHDARIDTSLTLYNRDAVNRILREEPDVLLPPGKNVSKKIRAGKAARWESQKLQSVMMQGIMQGDSIPKLASRLASEVEDSDYKAAVRNARTMSTNAQNAGRYDAYERMQKNGVDLTLEWAATLDNRTRHEHRMMHGQRRDVGEPFVVDGIEIMYPAQTGNFMGVSQSDIPQQMIWNCRCTILAFVKGFEHDTIKHSDKMGDMTFDEWLEAKAQPQDILHQKNRGDQFRDEYIREYAFPYDPNKQEHGNPKKGEKNIILQEDNGIGGLKMQPQSVTSGYTDSTGARIINSALRKDQKLSDYDRSVVERMDNAMQETTKKMTVYREFSPFDINEIFNIQPKGTSLEDLREAAVGATFQDKGFMSTYHTPTGNKYYAAVMEIDAKPGTKAILTSNVKENEVLLGRNQKWKVEDVELIDGRLVFHVTNAKRKER